MIAIFSTLADAQAYSDKIHAYLLTNCPGYNAVKWQEPQKHCKEDKFYIQIPQEYEKDLYPVKKKIQAECTAQLSKASEQLEKLPEDWNEEDIDDIITKPITK